MTKDKRPDPRPRKYPQLWQSYLWWRELVELRKRHVLRLSSIEAGKSNMDAGFERAILGHTFGQLTDDGIFMQVDMDTMVELTRKTMVTYGQNVGPIFDWLVSIKGIGDSLASQLLAQIQYPAPFVVDGVSSYPDHCATISKLWRFAGMAVIDGQIDRCEKGTKSPYNRLLKSICWLIVKSFITQQTPVYADIYYAEKARQRELHPEKIQVNGKWKYNDGHLHLRAMRKVAKIFLQHVWLIWRECEGLPVSKPWVIAQGGHANYIPPPNWPMQFNE